MGGKSGTTTSSVSIPPDVLKRYNAVNAYASDVAQTPFQAYQGQFVAGLTPTQQAGIQGTSQYANAAQPYYGAATQQLMNAQASAQPGISAAYQSVGGAQDIGQQYAQGATQGIGAALQYAQPYQAGSTQAAFMGAQSIQPGQLNTAQYMNPYTQAVADTTYQALRQQQQQEMQGATANAIRSGAFGGDRSGLVAANLARQQQLGTAQAMAPIYQQGYGQALQTAQQQQGVQLSADQANRAAMQNLAQQLQGIGQQGYGQQMGAAQQLGALGQQQYGQGMGAAAQLAGLAQQGYGMGAATSQALAGLGSGAQQAGLQGAQAQMGAGTLEQQTQQADLTARYQQFLQERGYPFQTAQFLANIAMGTGALSGSTTQTTQPMPFFSDRRVKHDVKEIGKTNDGQPIYSFKYNGDDSTQIGLMAQDVEKKHPDAVGEYGGIKTVDYKKATEGAERPERYAGGIVPASMGGAVNEPGAYNRGGYAYGGDIDPNDLQALLQQQQQALGPFGEKGLYGQGHAEGNPFGQSGGIVPKNKLHVGKLMVSKAQPKQIEGLGGQALDLYKQGKSAYNEFQQARDIYNKLASTPAPEEKGGVGSDAASSKTPAISSDSASSAVAPDKEQGWGEWLASKLFADGGVVPRKHFVQGGTAFHDPYKPYDFEEGQVPDEVLELDKPAELQKANTPSGSTSQTGVGLGDVAKLAMLFLKDGGAVPRHGYATDGEVVSEQNQDDYSLNAAKEILRQREGFLDKPKYDVNALRAGYGTDQFTTPEGGVVPVTAETRFTKEDAERDLSRRTPMFMQKAQSDIGPEAWAKLTPDAKAALTSVTYNYGSVPKSVVEAAQSGDMAAVGDAVYGLRGHNQGINAGRRAYEARFINPQGEYQADVPARGASNAQGVKPSQESQGIMPGVQNWLAENQGWLAPTGAFLKGMVQSKSPFLGGALLEGAGAGLEAIGPAQAQIAQTGLTQASKGLTEAETRNKGFQFVPGIGGFMWVIDKQSGQQKFIPYSVYSESPERYVTSNGPQPKLSPTDASSINDEFNVPSVGTNAPTGQPSTGETQPQTPPTATVEQSPNFNQNSVEQAKQSVKEIQKAQSSMMPGVATSPIEEGNAYRKGVVGLANATRANFGNTIDYIKNIADATELGGWQTPGTKSQLRGDAAKVFGTLASAFGVDPSLNLGDVNDINNKMKALRSQMMAQSAGQESLGALELLSNAMVNGDMSKETMAKLGAITLMLEGRAMDRLDHADKWGQVTGGSYFKAGKNFEEVNSTRQFDKELNAVTTMIKDFPDITKELFASSPEEIDKAFMENFGLPNMSRYFRAR